MSSALPMQGSAPRHLAALASQDWWSGHECREENLAAAKRVITCRHAWWFFLLFGGKAEGRA